MKKTFISTPAFYLPAIFLVALFFRLLYIRQIIPTPIFEGFTADADNYKIFAVEITKGNFFYKDSICLNSVYPFFLAVNYLIFGQSSLPVLIVQGILDSANCILIYCIAAILLGRRVGIIAALIYACYGLAIFYSGILLAPSLVVFCSLLFILTLLNAQLRRNSILFVVSGILFGVTVAARPNIALLFFLLPLWFFVVLRKSLGFKYSLRAYIFLLFGFLLVTSLFSARNYRMAGEFSPSVVGGLNFYIGNNPDAKGYFMTPQGISISPVEQMKTSIRVAEKESGRSLTYSQASRHWLQKGLSYLWNNPGAAAGLYGKKFALFWRKEELSHNIDYNLCKSFAPIFRYPFITYGLIAPLAILGIILGVMNRKNILLVLLIIFSSLMSVMIFFMSERYRLPAVPFLIICASYGLAEFAAAIQLKHVKKLCISGAILAALILVININYDNSGYSDRVANIYHLNVGKHLFKQGKLDEAAGEIRKALAANPSLIEAHYHLGLIYDQKGDVNSAIDEYKEEIDINPNSDEAHNNLGIIYVKQGRLAEGMNQFERAVALNPENAMAHSNLGDAFFRRGDFANAISEYAHALRIGPDLLMANYRMALALTRQGKSGEAAGFLEKAIAIKPDFAEAHNNLGIVLAWQGKIDEAIAHFQEAVKINPEYEEARVNLENAMKNK